MPTSSENRKPGAQETRGQTPGRADPGGHDGPGPAERDGRRGDGLPPHNPTGSLAGRGGRIPAGEPQRVREARRLAGQGERGRGPRRSGLSSSSVCEALWFLDPCTWHSIHALVLAGPERQQTTCPTKSLINGRQDCPSPKHRLLWTVPEDIVRLCEPQPGQLHLGEAGPEGQVPFRMAQKRHPPGRMSPHGPPARGSRPGEPFSAPAVERGEGERTANAV